MFVWLRFPGFKVNAGASGFQLRLFHAESKEDESEG